MLFLCLRQSVAIRPCRLATSCTQCLSGTWYWHGTWMVHIHGTGSVYGNGMMVLVHGNGMMVLVQSYKQNKDEGNWILIVKVTL